MDVDIYLGLEGKAYCNKAGFGLVKIKDKKDMINANVRRSINKNTECENVPVTTPIKFCNPDITIQPEYPFDIGNEILVDSMKYGAYTLEEGKDSNPAEEELAFDINENSTNYQTIGVGGTVNISITPDVLSYHVIRVPLSLSVTILDISGADATAFFSIYTDTQYKYYRTNKAMAPMTLQYKVIS